MHNEKVIAIIALIGAVLTAGLGIVVLEHVSVSGDLADNIVGYYALVVSVIGVPVALSSVAIKAHLRRVLESISNRIQKAARGGEELSSKNLSNLSAQSAAIKEQFLDLNKTQIDIANFLRRDGNVQIVLNKLSAAERRLTESIEAAALTHAEATAEAGRQELAAGVELHEQLQHSMLKIDDLASDSRAQVETIHADTSSLADKFEADMQRLSDEVKSDLVSLNEKLESSRAETRRVVHNLLETVGTINTREDALVHLTRRIERDLDVLSSSAAERTSASITAGEELVNSTKVIMSRLGTVEEGVENLSSCDCNRHEYLQKEISLIVQAIRSIERSIHPSEQTDTIENRSLVDVLSSIELDQKTNLETTAKSAKAVELEFQHLRERIDAIESNVKSQESQQNVDSIAQRSPSTSIVRHGAGPKPEHPVQSDVAHLGSRRENEVEKSSYETQSSSLVANHKKSLSDIWRLVRKVRNDKDLNDVGRRTILKDLYAPLSSKDIRQHFVEDSRQYDIGVSFRSSMSNMMRLKDRLRGIGYTISPGGNNKSADLEFGRTLGVPGPETLDYDVPTSKIVPTPGTIIKPVDGSNSRGVFFVTNDGHLRSVKSGSVYKNLKDAKSEYSAIIRNGREVRWMVEEAVLDSAGLPARDFKVYMFYGEMAMSLEIARGASDDGKNLYASYDEHGHQIKTSPNHPQMVGSGVNWQAVEMAKKISLSSPTPFLRIDFLAGADKTYLGEITPHPGNTYAGDLYEEVDRKLGRYFLEAEARLYVDLLNGRRFAEYFEAYDVFDKQ